MADIETHCIIHCPGCNECPDWKGKAMTVRELMEMLQTHPLHNIVKYGRGSVETTITEVFIDDQGENITYLI